MALIQVDIWLEPSRGLSDRLRSLLIGPRKIPGAMVDWFPSDWELLVKDMDILGATNSDLGAFIQGKANLLIGDIIPTDFDDVWNATHYRPTGTSSGAANPMIFWCGMIFNP